MNITLDQSSVEVYVQKLISKYRDNGHKELVNILNFNLGEKYFIPCFMSFFSFFFHVIIWLYF